MKEGFLARSIYPSFTHILMRKDDLSFVSQHLKVLSCFFSIIFTEDLFWYI